jgi:hypothetical protein
VQKTSAPWSLNEIGKANFVAIVEESLTKQPLMFELRPSAFGILFEISQDESFEILHNVLRHYIKNIVFNKIK